jgi:hypothetical protein
MIGAIINGLLPRGPSHVEEAGFAAASWPSDREAVLNSL